VKGKMEAVYIFEIIDGDPEDIKELKTKSKDLFVQAIQNYRNKEFQTALKQFKQVAKINPMDQAALLYIGRCQKFIDIGIPDDWDGIERFS
jgi:Flp pilus assembly protein TadD